MNEVSCCIEQENIGSKNSKKTAHCVSKSLNRLFDGKAKRRVLPSASFFGARSSIRRISDHECKTLRKRSVASRTSSTVEPVSIPLLRSDSVIKTLRSDINLHYSFIKSR